VTLGAILVALGTAGLIIAEKTGRASARRIFKPLASAGFLLAALGAPAFSLPEGANWLLLVGLVLSAAGDMLLVGRRRAAFLAGMGVFALAYLAYGVWFLTAGGTGWLLLPFAVALLGIGHLVWSRLGPHVPNPLRVPVRTYIALASLVAASAIGYAAALLAQPGGASVASLAPALGLLLLYVSDLAVAQHRFVRPDWRNRAWGLPVYYVAQLLIASAVL